MLWGHIVIFFPLIFWKTVIFLDFKLQPTIIIYNFATANEGNGEGKSARQKDRSRCSSSA